MKKLIIMIIMSVPFLGITQEAQMNKGIELFENGDYDEAIVIMKQAIKLNDTMSDYYMWLGLTYKEKLQTASHFEKGILGGKSLDNYKKAVKLNPGNIQARIHLANYYIHAPSISGGSIKKAMVQAEEIKKYNPDKAVMLMAHIYSHEEEYDKAIGEYKTFIKLNPDNPNAYYQLGRFYQDLDRFDEATEMFELAMKVDNKAYASLYQIGRTAVFSGENLERGISSLQEYIEVNPGSPNPALDAAHWRLGMLYEKKGDLNLAKHEFSQALELKPEEAKYKDALKKIE